MKLSKSVIALIVTSFIWCVVLPGVWVNSFAIRMKFTYFESIQFFIPESVTAFFVVFTVLSLIKTNIASVIFALIGAMSAVTLKFWFGRPTYMANEVSFVLLLVLAYQLFNHNKKLKEA